MRGRVIPGIERRATFGAGAHYMPRRFRIVIAAAALTAMMQFSAAHSAHAEPSASPTAATSRGCLVFEDDSFICGTWRFTDADDWELADSTPFVSGCIPGGLCDEPTPYTDDCPSSPPLEDVECWNATHDGY